jgi:hypothetical protein
MADDRRLRIFAALAATDGPTSRSRRLCEVSAEVTAMTGSGIMFVPGDEAAGLLCASDDAAKRIEDLQYTLGEGPCVDAHRLGLPVLEPDLRHPARPRWPVFAPAAVGAGARAIFAFPLLVGAVRLGALNLYRDRPGPIDDDQHAYALIMADVAARAVLDMQADASLGEIAAELETEADFHLVVHQAAGMISIQLDITVGEALIRLRSHAFLTGRLVRDVADDVVSRLLRLDAPEPT